jgi:molybdopterin synthase catalytic subunit
VTAGRIRLRVRFFALQRQLLGTGETTLEVPAGSTVADAWAALAATHPQVATHGDWVRFARNGVHAAPDEPLLDGDELAVIPPVAGGARDEEPARYLRLELSAEPIDETALLKLQRAIPTPEDGAVVSFLGRTRSTPGSPAPGEETAAARFAGQAVIGLEYEAFESMALAVLASIAEEVADRYGVERLAVLHRTGRVEVGEISVAIVAAAPHRANAFDACRYVIEELKARAPIWKSEQFADGAVWLANQVPKEVTP